MKLSTILLVALLIIPVSSSFAQEKSTSKSEKPSFTLIPEAGPAGTKVDIIASGFPADWKITLPPGATSDSTTTELGSFEFKVTIPADAKDGPYIIPVKVGDVNFKAVFTVRHAWHGPAVSPPPSSYVPGKFVNGTKQNSEFKLGTLPSNHKYTVPTITPTPKYTVPTIMHTPKYTVPTIMHTPKYTVPTIMHTPKYTVPTFPSIKTNPTSKCLPGMHFDLATKKCFK